MLWCDFRGGKVGLGWRMGGVGCFLMFQRSCEEYREDIGMRWHDIDQLQQKKVVEKQEEHRWRLVDRFSMLFGEDSKLIIFR